MNDATSPPSPEVLAAAVRLAIDAGTAEVVRALRASGISTILLKGPVLARLLYDDEASRPYGDIDLLVSPQELLDAERVLSELGFVSPPDVVHYRPPHAETWFRERDMMAVDLHRTLVGVAAAPERVWGVLAADTERVRTSRLEVEVLSPPGQALQIALHAAQHGARIEKPLTDLTRALERMPTETWRAAAALAEALDAVPAFAAGLRLLPEGESLAAALGLAHRKSAEVVLRARTPPPVARGFARLARTPGLGAKARLVGREIVPEIEFMRRSSRLARRGAIGLVAAYAWRLPWLLWHAGPGLAAWRRARREELRGPGG